MMVRRPEQEAFTAKLRKRVLISKVNIDRAIHFNGLKITQVKYDTENMDLAVDIERTAEVVRREGHREQTDIVQILFWGNNVAQRRGLAAVIVRSLVYATMHDFSQGYSYV